MFKQSRALQTVFYVAPLLLWMTFIFGLSTDKGSAAHTRPLVQSILRRVWLDADRYLTAEQIDRVDWNIRKCAHVTEYNILGMLIYRALAFGSPRFRSRYVILTILLGVLYAAGDEYHQSFVPSRGAAAADVFFDSYGIITGTLLCLWRHCHHTSRSEQKSPG